MTAALVLATRNPGKLAELRALLPGVRVLSLDDAGVTEDVEETGATFEDNARMKARAVHARTGLPALADDSGLEVDALGGAPGVRSARFAGDAQGAAANNAKLVSLLRGREAPFAARFRCALALEPGGVVTTGVCEGEIVLRPRGAGGFGYDPHFLVPALGKTMAELSPAEKNAVSHRGEALRAMLPHLPSKSK